ncbi:hypothetical protein KIS1582_0839 [Cytobacillus firmus]|uniref:Uncharacterized protein n=1 Tax=Cytobacillus firmus TaxID=1399 RepID=A0A800NEE0_CYTFI|nr:hypothetical protein KIS1582_0839 [Cytobacillus firmus]
MLVGGEQGASAFVSEIFTTQILRKLPQKRDKSLEFFYIGLYNRRE